MGEREQRSMLEKPRSMLEVAPKSIFDGYHPSMLETPRSSAASAPINSSGGVNHNYGNVSVFPFGDSEKPSYVEESKSPLEWLSQGADLGESISTGLNKTGAQETFGTYGDVLNVYKGGAGMYGGVHSMLENGVTKDNALDATKGALDTTAGFAGLFGSSPLKGYAGMASGGIDMYRGLSQAISSSDVGQASAGANQLVEGIGSTISSYGDKTGNPALMAGGRALNLGMAIGKPLVAATDRHAINADLYHDEFGNATTGSHRAGMVGRDVQDYLHDTWVPDVVGDVAGGVAAIGTGIGASAVSGVHAVGEAIFGGPSIFDIARAQLERQ